MLGSWAVGKHLAGYTRGWKVPGIYRSCERCRGDVEDGRRVFRTAVQVTSTSGTSYCPGHQVLSGFQTTVAMRSETPRASLARVITTPDRSGSSQPRLALSSPVSPCPAGRSDALFNSSWSIENRSPLCYSAIDGLLLLFNFLLFCIDLWNSILCLTFLPSVTVS